MSNQMKTKVKSRDMRQLSQYRSYLREHPRLVYLFVELTDRCNLACRHCGSSCDGKRGRFLETDLLLHTLQTVAEDFPPEQVMICLTGGEPMLHPDFHTIAERIVALGFPWGITTNGTLIDLAAAQRLKALRLGSITVSLDGLRETHEWLRRTPGCFQKTLDAVAALHETGIPVQITSVIHRRNYHELDGLYRLMCDLNVASWRVINLEPIGRGLDDPSLLLSHEEFTRLLDFIREKRYAKDTPMDVRLGCSHYLSFDYEHEVRDNYFFCGSGLYVASILCDGSIYSCLDIERRPELVQGHIAVDRFSEVWRDRFSPFREDRSLLCEACRDCSERAFCGGDSTHTWDFEKNEPMFCIRNTLI